MTVRRSGDRDTATSRAQSRAESVYRSPNPPQMNNARARARALPTSRGRLVLPSADVLPTFSIFNSKQNTFSYSITTLF
ncbi:hypothetical protein J6590_027962 [Homalodisca vitripennis]|nr:hypothetical protein J6590_027962 [Homalodisca vitripennis]